MLMHKLNWVDDRTQSHGSFNFKDSASTTPPVICFVSVLPWLNIINPRCYALLLYSIPGVSNSSPNQVIRQKKYSEDFFLLRGDDDNHFLKKINRFPFILEFFRFCYLKIFFTGFLHFKALFTRDILAHNIAIKRYAI